MADHERRPRARAKQASDGNVAPLFLNITAMVLVVIAFLLHNWPAQNSPPHAVQQPSTTPVSAPVANP